MLRSTLGRRFFKSSTSFASDPSGESSSESDDFPGRTGESLVHFRLGYKRGDKYIGFSQGAQKLSERITWSFCSRRVLYSRLRRSCQQNPLASVSERLPRRLRGSEFRLPQFSGTVTHRTAIESPAPLHRSSLNKVKCEPRGGTGVLHMGKDLTSSGVVGKLSFPSEGCLDRQRTGFCDVYNFEVAFTVQDFSSVNWGYCSE